LPFPQDASVEQRSDLAVSGGVGKVGATSQVADAQLITGEQQGGQQKRFTVAPKNGAKKRRLFSPILDTMIDFADSKE